MNLPKFLSAIFAVLIGLSASAQKHYEANITIGGKAGATMSRISFSPSVPQSMLNGIMMGVTFRYIEERNFGLIAEVNVEQRGWKEKFEETPYQYQRKLTYIQIPFLTHIYFGSTKFHGFFNAGPEISYLIGERTSSNFDVDNISNLSDFPKVNRSLEQLSMPVENKFDYGISVGLGIEYFIKRNHSVNLEGRLYYGLGNIYGSSKSDVFAASRGMAIQVTLGYNFRLR